MSAANAVYHIDKQDRLAEQRDVMLDFVLKNLRLSGEASLLDIGCGLGVFLESVNVKKKTGVDLDPECIEITKKYVPEAELHVADACALPFPDETFDTVVAICLLEHVENPTAFIKEAYRVTKIGGRALITTPNIGRPLRLMLAAQRKEKWERSGHRQGYDYHLMKHCLENNGWRVERILTRFVDCPFYKQLPRFIGNFMSHKLLPRLFPNIGSELYAFCRKVTQ